MALPALAQLGGAIGAGANVLGGAASIFGPFMGAGAQAGAARSAHKEALREKRRIFEARRKAFESLRSRGDLMSAHAERQFQTETGQPLPELQAAQQAALAGTGEATQQALAQSRAAMAQSGIRGGQAGQLLSRQAGQMGIQGQRQLDEMGLQEAQRRRQLRAGLFGQKTMTGMGASLSHPTF